MASIHTAAQAQSALALGCSLVLLLFFLSGLRHELAFLPVAAAPSDYRWDRSMLDIVALAAGRTALLAAIWAHVGA
jgi:hypothetical protein